MTDRPDGIPAPIDGNEEAIIESFLEGVEHMRYELPLWQRVMPPDGPLHLRCSATYRDKLLRANYYLRKNGAHHSMLLFWQRDHTIDFRDEYGLLFRNVGKELETPLGTVVLWDRSDAESLAHGTLRLVLQPEEIIAPIEIDIRGERKGHVVDTRTESDRWDNCRYDPPAIVRGEWVKPREETTRRWVVEWAARREEEGRIKLWLNPDIRIRFLVDHHLEVGTNEYGRAMRRFAQQKLCSR